ncbi:hypothetical protein ACLKA6_012313 [Drosophila palustris]
MRDDCTEQWDKWGLLGASNYVWRWLTGDSRNKAFNWSQSPQCPTDFEPVQHSTTTTMATLLTTVNNDVNGHFGVILWAREAVNGE